MNTPNPTQQSDDILRQILREKYLDSMNASYSEWKQDRRIYWEKYWTWGILVIAFAGILECIFLGIFYLDMSPDDFDSVVYQANPIMTPATAAIMAVISGRLTKAVFKTKVWNVKCTIVAVISGFLGMTVRAFQIFLVYLTMFVSLFPFLYFMEAFK